MKRRISGSRGRQSAAWGEMDTSKDTINSPKCNCHIFFIQGAAEQMPRRWTYLARASAPHSSTLTLLQTLVMSCFSSAVQCTMVAGGFAQSCGRTQTP